ncbi:MAG TPA: hypothetical protein VF173_07855 [Thermoanaerobaculia bacterium]|nr:hypothetical protein [Thermoanaerobaculia bacterium]
MSSQLSVAQVLANLEAQMAVHKEREAHHAQQEAFHREQRALHAAQYEDVAQHYEAFKASAGKAAEIAARSGAPSPPPAPEPSRPAKPALPSRLVARLVKELPAEEVFGSRRMAAEVNQRYARELRKPMDTRLASTALRRLVDNGTIRVVQKGTAYHEALYSRR